MVGVLAKPIELAIVAQARTDQERLWIVLEMLAAVDPFVGVMVDQQTGQTILKGPDEFHLEFVVERLKVEFGIAVNVGTPQVAYRETLGRRSEIDYTHKKQSGGGSGQFARIKVVFEPGALGSGYSFENKVVGGSIPKEFIPGVEKGLAASRETGVLAGFPVIDFKVTLVDGNYHDVDSSVLAFEIAARAAFRDGLTKAQCKLLEPIMKVEVTTPLGFENDVISDLNTRRARHHGLEARGNAQVIHVLVPLANMFGYANSLKELTQRHGAYGMIFDHYAPIPGPDDDEPFPPTVGMRA
jgi:elongation factor G